MKKVTILYGVLLLCAAVNNAMGQQVPLDPELRTGKLPNGQTYYIRHSEQPKGRADFYLAQKVGSVLEEEKQRGLAHFLEHMAFNGSKHFPGNSLISELEKKGIRFGMNINAYTSFDETVYNLSSIPVNREGIIDTALLVLHDWSGFLTLDDKEIDEERGVIREEWRLSAGGGLRVLQKDIYPVILAGTPYANRLPIGLMDVVNNFKYQELKDYYKKWYRPDLQGIIVVGDIDVDKVEAKIKKMFADIPAPVNPAPRTYAKIPDNAEPIVVYGVDKEITSTQVNFNWKMEAQTAQQRASMEGYKRSQINQIISGLLNNRFNEVREKPDAPFSSAYAYATSFEFTTLPSWNLNVYPKEKKDLLKAFRGAFTEIQRMHRYGFTEAELVELKKGILVQLEKQYTDRENKTTREFISEYIKLFLKNEPAPGIEWEYPFNKKLVSNLSIDTVNYYAQKVMLTDRNMVVYAIAPTVDNQLPSKEELIRVWEESKKAPVAPYVYQIAKTQLLEKKPIPGKITKTESQPFGFTRWTLSNGAKVWFKKTDYKEDKIQLRAYSPGGYSLVSDQDLPSGRLTGMVRNGGYGKFSQNELDRALQGKDARVEMMVSEYEEFMDGASSVKDREAMFQLLYLKMTVPPRKDQQYFDAWKKGAKDALKDRYANPDVVFKDTLSDLMSSYNPRAISYERDSVRINQVNYDKVLNIYRERFADAGNFTFFISGNVQADSIRQLVETYIGGLSALKSHENVKDSGIYPPKGIVKKHFNQTMVTPKSSVYVAYTGQSIPYTLKNTVLIAVVGSVLNINYLESMREKEGGVYYVSVGGAVEKFPKDNFNFGIRFSTDPDPVKKAKLMKIMYAEIDKLMQQGPSLENLDKVKGNMVKTAREWSDKQDANYWNYSAYHLVKFGEDLHNDYEKTISSVTPEMVREFAKKLFTQGNIVEVVMDPETK